MRRKQCSSCGYNKCIQALDFHHTDPSIKDGDFSNSRSWSDKRFFTKLDKCILLCANCHKELHANE